MHPYALIRTGPAKQLLAVNVNVDVDMSGSASDPADTQIRISERNKDRLDRRKREGESYNDVIDRLLDDDRDLLAGFGSAADRDVTLEDVHEETKRRSRERIDRFASGRGDDG